MKRIHQKLSRKLGWYRKWHNHPKSDLFHNLLLAVLVPLFGFLIIPFALTFAQVTFSVTPPAQTSWPDFYIPPTATPTPTPQPLQEKIVEKTYTVQPGDTLSSIAQQIFGDSNRYQEIVDLNKEKYPQLLQNPNLIEPGMVLIVGSEKILVPPPGGIIGERPKTFESGVQVAPEVLDFLDIFNIVALVFLGLLIVAGAARYLIVRV